ncbi:MAG: GntP family permease [Treponema sp.]|nr:GntP family permease [Treponema sp.]
MQTVFLILAIILITILCIRGVPIFFGAIITSVFVLLTAHMDVVGGITGTFAGAFAGFVQSNFLVFLLGAIFGKILELSGAADSIANFVVDKLGEKAIVPAIILAGGIMGYGGISVFIGMFTLYPLMFSLFKKANISSTLAPGIYVAAAGSFTVWMPGSPAIQLLVPAQALGTTTFAAAVPGFIAGGIQIILEIVLCSWYVNYTKKKGLGWDEPHVAGAPEKSAERKNAPSFLLAIIPMAILICALGFIKAHAAVGMTIGIVAALIFYAKYLPWKDGMWQKLQMGVVGGTTALVATCSAVGFGGVVQSTEAFQNMIQAVVGMNGNPVIISVVIVAVLAGVCGSGTGGEGMALPIINEYFVPMGANVEALTRGIALSTMIFTLPNNSVVNSAITAAGSTHKKSYFLMFLTVPVMSLVSMIILLLLFKIMGYM